MNIRIKRIPRTLQPGGAGHQLVVGTAAATVGAAGAGAVTGIGTAVSTLGFTSVGTAITGVGAGCAIVWGIKKLLED